ncbi:hypothetical protein [Amphritea sp. HPY]|uniref:hypothetical protein n=1 Tax=Amphritea sp. HPY TaxID=3421652 RepID=UPI003D7DD274
MYQGTSIYSHKTKPSLFTSDGPAKELARASYQLPLCWLLMFREQDLQLQQVYSSEGEKTCEYRTLICTKDEALQRYDLAAERFKSLLSNRSGTYFDYWRQYIVNDADNYLHLDATALWMVGDEQAYLDNLKLSLSGVDWVLSGQCRWRRSRLEALPLIGRAFDPITQVLRHQGVNHLLVQSGILGVDGDIYIDKAVLQGDI